MKTYAAFLTFLIAAAISFNAFAEEEKKEDKKEDKKEEKKQQPDRKNMLGTWRGGFPNEKTPQYELIITEEKISGTNLRDGRSLGEGSWVLDIEKHTIDATMTSPRKSLFLGTYALEGDNLKWVSDNGRG